MNKDVVEVQVRAVLPLEGSFAVFLGNESKVFVIYIDESVGTAISMFMRGVSKERPLTHDLVGQEVFHARLIISAENELHTTRKMIELDARPSDSIAMAVQQSAPIFVAQSVWDAVEDVSDTLAQIEKKGLEAQQASETAAKEEGDDDDEIEELSDEDINAIAGISGAEENEEGRVSSRCCYAANTSFIGRVIAWGSVLPAVCRLSTSSRTRPQSCS
jgi:bifunctional DNase/RNase